METIKLKNTDITISELGEERTFISGTKNWRIDWAEIFGQRFEVGDTVKWIDEDAVGREKRVYKGKIEWLIVTADGEVEISTDMPTIGRLDVDSVSMIKKAKINLVKSNK
jgi:hypothetical protein